MEYTPKTSKPRRMTERKNGAGTGRILFTEDELFKAITAGYLFGQLQSGYFNKQSLSTTEMIFTAFKTVITERRSK